MRRPRWSCGCGGCARRREPGGGTRWGGGSCDVEEIQYDGNRPETVTEPIWVDVDGDGSDAVEAGADDCDDQTPGPPRPTEVAYDGVDNDCATEDLVDVDGDGPPRASRGDDCDDADRPRSPGSEACGDGVLTTATARTRTASSRSTGHHLRRPPGRVDAATGSTSRSAGALARALPRVRGGEPGRGGGAETTVLDGGLRGTALTVAPGTPITGSP